MGDTAVAVPEAVEHLHIVLAGEDRHIAGLGMGVDRRTGLVEELRSHIAAVAAAAAGIGAVGMGCWSVDMDCRLAALVAEEGVEHIAVSHMRLAQAIGILHWEAAVVDIHLVAELTVLGPPQDLGRLLLGVTQEACCRDP